MARFVAFVIAALLVLSLAAETVSAQKFCRTSAYKIDLNTAKDNKMKMFKNCGADVTVTSAKMVDGCAVIVQQVANKAAWDKYSDCEKSGKNSALYGPLKAASSACASKQGTAAC